VSVLVYHNFFSFQTPARRIGAPCQGFRVLSFTGCDWPERDSDSIVSETFNALPALAMNFKGHILGAPFQNSLVFD
jgi:hypothetical protein